LNSGAIHFSTKRILSAVHLCQLKLRLHARHSLTVDLISLQDNTIQGFFAQSHNTHLSLCGLGWFFIMLSAAQSDHMNAKLFTFQDFIIGVIIVCQSQYMMFTAHLGKQSANHFCKRELNNTQNFAGLKITVLPVSNAGISVVKVSLRG
jgi:hypothetical protein